MDEIELFLDKEQKEKVINSIEFGIIKAGEKTEKSIYLKNNVPFEISYELKLNGENISLVKKTGTIEPNKTIEVKFEIFPKITTMKPIKANLNFNGRYVIT